jgi:hypothetical protein
VVFFWVIFRFAKKMFNFRFEHLATGRSTFVAAEKEANSVQYVSPDGDFFQLSFGNEFESDVYLVVINAEDAHTIITQNDAEETKLAEHGLSTRLSEISSQLEQISLDDKSNNATLVGELFLATRKLERAIAQRANELVKLPARSGYVFTHDYREPVQIQGVIITCIRNLSESQESIVARPLIVRKGDRDIGSQGDRFMFDTQLLSWEQNAKFAKFSITNNVERWQKLTAAALLKLELQYTKYCVIIKQGEMVAIAQFQLVHGRPQKGELRLLKFDEERSDFIVELPSLERLFYPQNAQGAFAAHFGDLTLSDVAKGSLPLHWNLDRHVISQVELFWVDPSN